MGTELYRQLPLVDSLLADARLEGLPHALVVAVSRTVLEGLRADIGAGRLSSLPDVGERVLRRAHELTRSRLQPVLNATGIVVHTNLGRSPWSDGAVQAAIRAARYCDLELDLTTGKRGGRLAGLTDLVRHLTGAEAALVVNNCAAAVLLALTALARGREVVVSRGELVEIGGSFRIPDVIASGGAVLKEVGATNRTHLKDYANAIGDNTAVLLRVHPSNFRVMGFTETVNRADLVALGAKHGLPVVEDLGSGSIDGLRDEPSVREVVQAGVGLALFSGDKLLGGPQAGVIVGRADLVETLRKHPLYRALRVDKVILAALEQTLAEHISGQAPPTLAMIGASPTELQNRADQLQQLLEQHGVDANCAQDVGYVGGGSLPGQGLPGPVLQIPSDDLERITLALRTGEYAVVARVSDRMLILDPRTLTDAQLPEVARQVASAVQGAV